MNTLLLSDENLGHYDYHAVKIQLESGSIKLYKIKKIDDFMNNLKHALDEVNPVWVKAEILHIFSENEYSDLYGKIFYNTY